LEGKETQNILKIAYYSWVNGNKELLKEETTVKTKESRNRPGVPQRVPGGLGSQIS
jgi:hypothetical protein